MRQSERRGSVPIFPPVPRWFFSGLAFYGLCRQRWFFLVVLIILGLPREGSVAKHAAEVQKVFSFRGKMAKDIADFARLDGIKKRYIEYPCDFNSSPMKENKLAYDSTTGVLQVEKYWYDLSSAIGHEKGLRYYFRSPDFTSMTVSQLKGWSRLFESLCPNGVLPASDKWTKIGSKEFFDHEEKKFEVSLYGWKSEKFMFIVSTGEEIPALHNDPQYE